MNKFTTSIVRLDYDEPVSLTDVSADMVMYAGILETIVEKMESI